MIGLTVILVSYLIAQGILFVYFVRKILTLQNEFKKDVLTSIDNFTESVDIRINNDLRIIYGRLDCEDLAIDDLRTSLRKCLYERL